jgi:ketosteroid isomerase-like protein
MPSENVEIVRQALAANRSGRPDETTEAVVAVADPSCSFTSRLTAVEGVAYRGHEGIREYFQDLADAFQEWTNETHEIEELRSDAVLTDITFRGVGRSGVGVELRSALLWVLFDGKVVRAHAYGTREEALQAVGASP